MLLAIWDDGVWQDTLRIAIIAVVAYLLVLWVAALVWTYRDAQARSRDPFMQALAILLVLVFNLPGLVVYLILRPKDTLFDSYDRQLEAEALLHEIQDQATCPTCRRKVDNEFIACPYCRSTLRTPCDTCGKPMSSTWVLCPYCGKEQAPAPVASSTPVRQEESAVTSMASRAKRPSTATYTPPAQTSAPVVQPADSATEVTP